MKKLVYTLAVLGLVFTSCSSDDMQPEDQVVETPSEVADFAAKYYPGIAYDVDVDYDDDGEISFDVDMENGVDLEFSDNGTLTSIDADDQAIPAELIPANIQSYIDTNYPNAVITSWELDDLTQSVELLSGIELVFDLDGNFITIDA